MKLYPKTYEDAFTSKRLLKKCKLEQIKILDGSTIEEYSSLMLEILRENDKQAFDFFVKHDWLARKFSYFGMKKTRRSGHIVDGAFGVFLRHHVGRDNRIYTRSRYYTWVTSYFDELFPDFEEGNPFKEEYAFPFNNVGLDHMCMIYQMDERMEILRYIDQFANYMPFTEFTDWIINWTLCYNEEHGEKYIFRQHKYRPPTVQKITNKNGKRKKRKTKAKASSVRGRNA